MTTVRIQNAFQGVGGNSKDLYTNTFYAFKTGGDAVADGPALTAAIAAFYTHATSSHTVAEFMSARAASPGRTIKVYDTANPPLSPPVYTRTDVTEPFTVANQFPLPEEVAVCLSYSALHSGANRPRRRGRIYVGPLNDQAMDLTIAHSAPTEVSAFLINALLGSAANLKTELAAAGWSWRVMSQSDGFAFDIIEVSVDDRFDTIRNRGPRTGSRVSNAI